MRARTRVGLVAVLGLLAGVSAVAIGQAGQDADDDTAEAARAAVERFLDGYLDPDGRVVRRDQGGDTVSEGQAYAMLAAVAVGDRERFDLAWTWAREHLQRPDDLLAFRWAAGRVVDEQPATDADLDAARALVLASRRFDRPAYREEAADIAAAVAELEIARVAGEPVLVAGPWAVGPPVVVNPSYLAPRAAAELSGGGAALAAATGHGRALVDDLVGAGGQRLPPDWAAVDEDGGVRAIGPPDRPQDPARYSYDAVRLPVRFAESCDPTDRAVAAGLWPTLREEPSAAERSLDGTPLGDARHAVAGVGAAAAAQTAGHPDQARRLLDEATRLDRQRPSYYGAAWVALARVMLTTDWLGTCPVGDRDN